MAPDAEGRLRVIQDLHLTRFVGLHPDGGVPFAYVAQNRAQDQLRHRALTTRRAVRLTSAGGGLPGASPEGPLCVGPSGASALAVKGWELSQRETQEDRWPTTRFATSGTAMSPF